MGEIFLLPDRRRLDRINKARSAREVVTSHFTKVESANIVSKESFIAACKELGYTAIKENSTIRGYAGQTQAMDVAVTVPDSPYDFGIKRNGPRYDLVAESMFSRERLGRIVQMTTKHTIMAEYRRKGFTARVHEDQQKNLVVTLTR